MSATRIAARPTGARPPRVVLDTKVAISALVFGKGVTAQLRTAWQAGRCLPLVSAASVMELVRVLAYPRFKFDPQERQE